VTVVDRRRLAERVSVPRNRAVGGWLKRLRRDECSAVARTRALIEAMVRQPALVG
jgi:hypothetical protein